MCGSMRMVVLFMLLPYYTCICKCFQAGVIKGEKLSVEVIDECQGLTC